MTTENKIKSSKSRPPPPEGKPFSKGSSGNPGGRPKRTEAELDLIRACKDKTPQALATLVRIMEHGEKERDQMTAAMTIIERAWGKPVQPTENEHSGSVTFAWLSE